MKAGPSGERFPWEAVLAFGLGRLRLSPDRFWALTLPEFSALAGLAGGFRAGIARRRLDDLMTMFPDGGRNG